VNEPLPYPPRATAAPGAVSPAWPLALLAALRPRQWVKNSVLFAGLLFTLDAGHTVGDWLRVLAAFALFCTLSSAIYLVNDLLDISFDRVHPVKRQRPLAAGQLAPSVARAAAAVLLAAGLGGALLLGYSFAAVAAGYVALTTIYSVWLKHAVLLDVMALAFCYVARAAAGAVVIQVAISPWLFGVTFLGALLLGLAKRRHELVTLDQARQHRRILEHYSVAMLDWMIVVVAASALVAYMLYTVTSTTAQQRPLLFLTTPFVVFGILRFFYLIHHRGKGGDPSSELPEDRQLLAAGLLWAAASAAIMLWGR
jgi:4-hydroxybenzoate polyprenyltransferase